MARDNFSMLFGAVASPTASAAGSSNASNRAVVNFSQTGSARSTSTSSSRRSSTGCSVAQGRITPTRNSSSSAIISGSVTERDVAPISREATKSDGDLIVGFSDDRPATTITSSASPATSKIDNSGKIHNDDSSMQQQHTKPGTESMQYLKKFGSMALKPLRELQLAEKLNAMNLEMEELQDGKEVERQRRHLEENDRQNSTRSNDDTPGLAVFYAEDNNKVVVDRSDSQLARELQQQEEEEECERIKVEADVACERVGGRYDALVKFTSGCIKGTYEEFIEFLLMGGGRSENDMDGSGNDWYDELMFEDFYAESSEYRKLWNDNLTLGLPEWMGTLAGRTFVPAGANTENSSTSGGEFNYVDPWHSHDTPYLSRQRSHSEEESSRNFGKTLRERTVSEGEKLKKQIAQVDKQKLKQGLGSAVNAISNASSFALKPLREFQLAEKLNAINIDMEEEEVQKEIDQYIRMLEEKRDMEEMMRIKKEAEESCMNATREHLSEFVRDNPDGTYQEWIEELHPENAHAGTLLEGLGKTIDHRFFVEESDHRRLWNDSLYTYLDPNDSSCEGRKFVPARARQTDDNGQVVVAADILTGSVIGIESSIAPPTTNDNGGKADGAVKSSDLIAFD